MARDGDAELRPRGERGVEDRVDARGSPATSAARRRGRPGRRCAATSAANGSSTGHRAPKPRDGAGRDRPSRRRRPASSRSTRSPRRRRSRIGLRMRWTIFCEPSVAIWWLRWRIARVAQPAEALVEIGERVDAGDRRAGSAGSPRPACAGRRPVEHRVRHVVEGMLVAGEQAEIGERGLRGVEHAHLDQLERRHVVDEGGAGQVPGRRPAGEAVLDHPLPERLADHHRGCRGSRRLARRRRCRRAPSPARCGRPWSRERRRCASIQRARSGAAALGQRPHHRSRG